MKLTEEQMQAAWDKYERGDGLSRAEVKAMLEQIGPALSYLRQRSAKFGTLVKSETVLTAERLMGFDLELQSQEEGVLRVVVDLSGIQEADNERNATTYYGGRWRVGEKEGLGYGDDRSDNHYDDVKEEIVRLCQERWPDEDVANDGDLIDSIQEVLTNGTEGDPFTLVVKNEGGGAWHVFSEEAP